MKLLHNAQIFTKNILIQGYLTIEHGKIKKIAEGNPPDDLLNQNSSSIEIIDCQNGILIPGFIDTHVHFRDMDQAEKETLTSGSMGAISAGVTTVLTMPNTSPPLSTAENIDAYLELMKNSDLYCNIGIFAGIKEGFSIENFTSLVDRGIFGIKIYPGDNPDTFPLIWDIGWAQDLLPNEIFEDLHMILRNFTQDYPNWQKLFETAKQFNLPLIFHPELPRPEEKMNKMWEDGLFIAEVEKSQNKYLFAHNVQHTVYANELANVEMITMFIRKFFHDPKMAPHVHFAHVSHQNEVEVVQLLLKDADFPASVEVTPHHIYLNLDSHFENENYAKVLVPLRTDEIQQNLLQKVLKNEVDTIGSDHAPHTLEEKMKSFENAPSGFPSIDVASLILLSEVFKESLTLSQIVKYYSTMPADIFQIPNKGEILEGYDADIVLVNKIDPIQIHGSKMFSKQKWTPWENKEICARIEKVFLMGESAYDFQTGQMTPHGGIIRPLVNLKKKIYS